MKILKILWMTPRWPFPIMDGARVATNALVRGTIEAGGVVDVLCLTGKDEKFVPQVILNEWNINDVFFIQRKSYSSKWKKYLTFLQNFILNPTIPLTFASFSHRSLQRSVKDHLDKNNYDLVLLDGLHLGATLFDFKKKRFLPLNSKVIYRAHNIEADLWKKSVVETGNPIKRWILKLQASLVEELETSMVNNVSGVAPIAQEDLLQLQLMAAKTPQKLVPLGLNFFSPLPLPNNSKVKFLFIGRLDWAPNRDGLKWLLTEVWPEVMRNRPEASLKIVGSGDGNWIKPYLSLPGIEFKGFVPDLKDAYIDSHFTIVPIHYGSGTRIKVLESFVMGRRLISTKMGVQGADLDENDYVQAETAQDWVRTLSTIELDEGQKEGLEISRSKIEKKFSEKEIGRDFYHWLTTVA